MGARPFRARGNEEGDASDGKRVRIDLTQRILTTVEASEWSRTKPASRRTSARRGMKVNKLGRVRIAVRHKRAAIWVSALNAPFDYVLKIDQDLYEASYNRKTSEAKRLIARGAPVDWQTGYGWTPLHEASRWGFTAFVMLLIKHDANLNKTNKFGDTPLILAAKHNKMANVRALIEAKADTTLRGDGNKTAAEWAEHKGHHGITAWFITIRFDTSARDESGQLHHVQGRALRAIERDLRDISNFDDHMLHRLEHFCTVKR